MSEGMGMLTIGSPSGRAPLHDVRGNVACPVGEPVIDDMEPAFGKRPDIGPWAVAGSPDIRGRPTLMGGDVRRGMGEFGNGDH